MREFHLSLRDRLLRMLLGPLLLVILLSAVYDYVRALERARDNQDQALARVAIALASRLDMDADDAVDDDLGLHLARTMRAMQIADGKDQLFFLVSTLEGAVIGGDPALAGLLDKQALAQASFADQRFDGREMRIITYPHASALGALKIVVAETLQRREAQARLVMMDTVIPNLVLLSLALLLVHLGVHLAMKPLDELSQAVAARQPEDFSAIATAELPADLLPLVRAINGFVANLRVSTEAQQAFLSNAAHQLRTPLAGMQMQLELAERDADENQRQRLTSLKTSLQRLARSTHQMLALARSGPQSVQAEALQRLDLQLLLEDAASSWLDAALAAGLDLGFEARPAFVNGSAWLLQEMLGNLIHNAIRHSEPAGKITVSCGTRPDCSCFLTVEDEGPGIDPREYDRVFERFYQVDTASKLGSGLGLAIVREVALRHGAQVSLGSGSSGASGKGLQVTVNFPIPV
ncbi:sensor histidine kinase [Paucibacter sp. TC2R-5]|uniref:sensor histidine kinase n=1 Tax=Paucibacter sp. TC2R-5 TaxID=2893555 RepID=UPI0021E43690|nr:sensor histidine kinase [Paucibacter sp. TC2R-5]MCV2361635.1 sensor histidine kinase [Paucibacter sp. TC2R-5]